MNDIDKATGFKTKKRKEIMGYFKNLPEQHIIDICHELTCMDGKKDDPMASYSKFLALINDRLWTETALSRKHRLSQKEIDLANEIKRGRVTSKRKDKISPLHDFVKKNYIWLISDLREEGLSWRQIALYIEMNHNVHVSHVYLRSIYMEEFSGKSDT